MSEDEIRTFAFRWANKLISDVEFLNDPLIKKKYPGPERHLELVFKAVKDALIETLSS